MTDEFPFLTEDEEFEPTGEQPTPKSDLLATVNNELLKSIGEELEAYSAYELRAQNAIIAGDKKTADLYRHIADEEFKHHKEFRARLADLST